MSWFCKHVALSEHAISQSKWIAINLSFKSTIFLTLQDGLLNYSTDSTVQPPTADWSHQRFPPVRFVTPLLHASQALSKHRNRQQKGPGFVGGPLDGTDGVLVVSQPPWHRSIGQHPYSGHVHKTRHLVGPQCDVHQQTMSPTSGFSSHVNKRAQLPRKIEPMPCLGMTKSTFDFVFEVMNIHD